MDRVVPVLMDAKALESRPIPLRVVDADGGRRLGARRLVEVAVAIREVGQVRPLAPQEIDSN